MALQTAADHYQAQRSLILVALAVARRGWSIRNMSALARSLAALMEQAAANGFRSVGGMVDEQGLDAPAVGGYAPLSLSSTATDGRPLVSLLEQAETEKAVERMAWTQVADAGRQGQALGMAARPALTGYARYLNPPSCGRCAVLAGRVYRWSTGFLRHPLCDCVMMPTTMSAAPGLVDDPMKAFHNDQIRGLSKADTEAIKDGADIFQVINAHRSMEVASVFGHEDVKITREGITRRGRAGRSLGSRKGSLAVRLMPESIYKVAEDRADAIRLLRHFGFII